MPDLASLQRDNQILAEHFENLAILIVAGLFLSSSKPGFETIDECIEDAETLYERVRLVEDARS